MYHYVRVCARVFSLQGEMFITEEVRMMTMVIKIKSRRKDTNQTSPGGNVCVHVCLCEYVCMCVRVCPMPCCFRGNIPPKGQILERPLFKVAQNLQNRGVCDFCLVSVAVNWSCSRLSSGYWEVCTNV